MIAQPAQSAPSEPLRRHVETNNESEEVVTPSQRLYGTPGAEEMHFSVADAYEMQVELDLDDEDRQPCVIEEWTTLPAGSTFLSAAGIVEWLCENAADDSPEGWYHSIAHLDRDPKVLAAAEALRTALIEQATPYWIADKRVAEHLITWNDAGEPLVNGEPMYVRAPAANDGSHAHG